MLTANCVLQTLTILIVPHDKLSTRDTIYNIQHKSMLVITAGIAKINLLLFGNTHLAKDRVITEYVIKRERFD